MKKKFLFGKNWFFEDMKLGEPPTYTWTVLLEKEIYSGKSKFQKINIFETEEFGRVLVLDGLVQLSTKHEFIYHEMLTHPALFYHPNPKKILIIGGGDGGVLREVVRHPVESIFLVEIDKKIVEVSKKYLPSLSNSSFRDKRLRIFIEDGLKFIKRYKNYFDVIIVDSTDPIGPSFPLFQTRFYRDIARALRGNGILAAQTAYFLERFAKKARKRIKKVFPYFKIHKAFVGCFPFDEHTFSFGSKTINFDKINFKKIKERYKKIKIKTKYYSPEIHLASAVFPSYLK